MSSARSADIHASRLEEARGWLRNRHHLAVEAAALIFVYLVYDFSRGLVSGAGAIADRHGRQIAHAEQHLSLYIEPSVQHALQQVPGLFDVFGFGYDVFHIGVTAAVLVWLYLRRPHAFPAIRTTIIASARGVRPLPNRPASHGPPWYRRQPRPFSPHLPVALADPVFTLLAEAMVNDDAQRLWLLQHTATQWGLDALDPDGLAIKSILPQFFGDADQPDALAAIRAWTAGLFDSLDEQDALIDSGALGHLEVPVSIIFGERDRYLNPSLAAEIAGLFKDPSLHLVQDASHWPQYDQPEVVAQLLKQLGDV